MDTYVCEKPFWKDFRVIFDDFTLQYKPKCTHQKWNFGARIVILSFLLSLILVIFFGINSIFYGILFGIITAFVIVLSTGVPDYNVMDKEFISKIKKEETQNKYSSLPFTKTLPRGYVAPVVENFANGGSIQGTVQPFGISDIDAAEYSGPALPEFTPPTSRNPFMNILLDEIKYNPTRPSGAPVTDPSVKQTFDDFFRVQWFSDPTDVFGKNQSQRQFVTQPSTSVPNDRESYQNWLYKIPGKTCKEGGREACLSNTDGSPVTWLNQDS